MAKLRASRGLVLGLLAAGLTAACAMEETIPASRIPKPVMDALLGRFPGARIEKASRAVEAGRVVYDIEFRQDGRKCEADIKENGEYLNYEIAIGFEQLPEAVRSRLEQSYPGASVKQIMEEIQLAGGEEQISAYEILVVTASAREVEVRFSPDGKILEVGRA
ncbi:MAG: hypothetical protein KatS3mg081_2144 [Gemmatimonadales bacterium]|nr:MAG: hypothetical protein KatS3mg081_2144 [Gemmatimonadales bacterium]